MRESASPPILSRTLGSISARQQPIGSTELFVDFVVCGLRQGLASSQDQPPPRPVYGINGSAF